MPHASRPLPTPRRTTIARTALVALLSAAAALPLAAHADEWRQVSSKDGIVAKARDVPGHRFDQLRVSTRLDVPPDVVADYLFGRYLDEKNKNLRRSFSRRDPAVTVWSDILDAPVISERCYSMRFERHALDGGGVRVAFSTGDYAGTVPMPDCTALHARGEWRMTPTADGTGTRLTYTTLTDIGGKVPAFLARRSLVGAAISSVRKVAAGSAGLPLPPGPGD